MTKIFKLPILKQIEIEVTPPNALGDVERQLMKFLEDQNADKYTQTLMSKDPRGLVLTNDTKLAARVAQSNGHVSAKGIDEIGQVVKLSTQQHPYEEKVTFDPKIAIASDVFEEISEQLLNELAKPVSQR